MPDLLLVSKDNKLSTDLENFARSLGYRSKTANSLQQAIEWAKIQPFDLCLIDSAMGKSGLEDLTSVLWAENSALPVIAFAESGMDFKSNQIEFSLLGIELFDTTVAFEQIKKLLNKIAQNRANPNIKFEIMVVEDLDSPRDIICSYVEHIGYSQVTGFSSAHSALQELENHPGKFSCVITDINMPGINGKQLIEVIRKHKKLQHLPIVVLTAYGTADNLVECLEAGASGFLVKPPTKNDLNRELGRALRIISSHSNPRLVNVGDMDKIREVLLDRGFN